MIYIVIAAFNEASKIAEVIADLHKHNYNHIIVIDDGSKDATAEAARKAGATVIQHAINRGQGAALQTGMDFAIKEGASIIVHFDADGQHLASDIRTLTDPVQRGDVDIALGNRFIGGKSNPPLIRRLFLKGGALLMSIFYGVKVTDSHNGFRAFSKKAAEKIRITSDRMEHASEIIELIGKHKLKYCEVPVTIKYTDYSIAHGQSSWVAFRILYKMIIKKIFG